MIDPSDKLKWENVESSSSHISPSDHHDQSLEVYNLFSGIVSYETHFLYLGTCLFVKVRQDDYIQGNRKQKYEQKNRSKLSKREKVTVLINIKFGATCTLI